jgi:two-component system sensor histidine kinase PhcS
MLKEFINSDPEAVKAYSDYEQQITTKHLEVGCLLAIVLMPAGIVLDYFVYPEKLYLFGAIRIFCSVLVAGLWLLLHTDMGRRNTKAISLSIAMLPAASICVMIMLTEGASSPYYAGLNLVLLSIAFVLRWTVGLSVTATMLVIFLYVGSCVGRSGKLDFQDGLFVNNLYFLTLTGLIVVIGSRIHRVLRVREFVLRYELDASNLQLNHKKDELENSNQQLSQKTGELEHALVELRQTQDQLVMKEKQASLGVWSAGIIHEMNNPLNFARTGLYALRNKDKLLPPGEQADFKEVMADVEDGIKRVQTIVSDLRTYAHPGTETCEDVNVADVMRVALRFFSGDLKGRVEVIQNIPPGQTIFADRNKLIQVFGNLLHNSVDALKTKQFDEGHPVIAIEGRVEGGRSLLVIRDNGPGIETKHMDKIFDPFFTTKDVGEGVGLGLGICYRIVQEFGGKISVRSEPGQFCEFALDFPAERPVEPAD